MKLTDKIASATHRVLVYGAPKTGKSLLVGKLAEHYELDWFDSENGWSVLTQLPKEWQARINIISVPDSRVYPIAAETWLKTIKGDTGTVCETHGKWNCALCKKDSSPTTEVSLGTNGPNKIVVFDSLTQFTNSIISHITKGQPDDYKLQLDDWGNLKVLVDKFLGQVQAARYNIICITHEEQVSFEDGKFRLVPSSGSAKSSMNTAKYFDDVIYAEVKNKKHMFGSSSAYGMNMVTGSRSGVEIEKQAVPTLLDIFTEWRQGMELSNEVKNSGLVTSGVGTSNVVSTVDKGPALVTVTTANVTSNNMTKTPGQIALENMKSRIQGKV